MDTNASTPINTALIKEAFETPEWYLQRTGFNIKLRAETIREFVPQGNIGFILDIGCGDGSLSAGLLNSSNRLTLLDQSQAMLDIAGSRVPLGLSSRVRMINNGFMEASLEPQSFDLILCVGVLAYVEQRREFITRIKSLLKPGGTVVTECTDGTHFVSHGVVAYQGLRRFFKPAWMRTVVAPSSGVVTIFKELGFEHCGSFRYSLPIPGIHKLMSQKLSYQTVRSIFGTAVRNRNAWLGNECIYHFKYPNK